MKTIKPFISILLVCLLFACSTAKYLPSIREVSAARYGSYINITKRDYKHLIGELIAVTDTCVIVLRTVDGKNMPDTAYKNDVRKYYLIYANSSASSIIPFIVSLTHGAWMVFTMIINGIVTANLNYFYADRNLKYSELKMFARFPQGIPEGVDIRKLSNLGKK